MPDTNNTHKKNIVTAGIAIEEAKKALIMIHGRGGSADDILSLSNHLQVKDFALLAPQATNNTWYPYSFMAPSNILKAMHAAVTEKIYNNMGHTINQDEMDLANTLVFNTNM